MFDRRLCTPRSRRRTGLALPIAALLAFAGVAVAPAASAATSATVTVNAASGRGAIPAGGHGVNAAVYDGNMNHSAIPGLYRDAGFTAVRYPGGSYADIYHWQTGTAGGGYVAPNTGFDAYMATVRSAGAQGVIIANYGTGTAQEAADWVRYANITRGYGVKLWEIGNEVYGNGHYGGGWEADNHADKSPRAYATNVLSYISAMKAVDPSIKVGVVLTTPGGWPDGVVGPGDSADWNHTVMSIVQGQADFVIVHWYPGASSAADSLTKVSQISGMVGTLRSLINQYAGSRASSIGIAVTEMNPGYQLTSATAALFAVDGVLTWFENGAMNLDWWNTHNGTGSSPGTNDDGTVDYHDEGILSAGSPGEPAVNTPFPPYYGLAMVGRAGAPGDTLVQASSSTSLLAAHAVRTSSGLNVVLVNKDLVNSTTVSLSYAGFSPAGNVSVVRWQKGATSISTSSQSSATSITVPPYSITVLKTTPGGGGGDTTPPTAPSNLTASGITATGVTLSWTASTDNVGVTGYDILRAPGSSGGAFTQIGTSATTSFSDTGLTANTTYRYQVRARDAAGNTSATSGTVQVTTSQSGTAGLVRNVGAGRCLDVNAGSQANLARAIVWDCHGGANQQWTATAAGELRVYSPAKCLDVLNQGTASGSAVEIYDCNGGNNQKWTFNANGTITGTQSGLCLTPSGGGTANGTLIVIATCNGSTSQQWTRQ
jgi:chitodextrinase